MVEPLTTRWPAHTEDEIAAVAEVLRSGRTNYWQAPEGGVSHGQRLEAEVSTAWGVRNVLAVSNGTTALECCLRGLELRDVADRYIYEGSGVPGVIVPARTFVATASAVHNVGGEPVLADIDPSTLCVTPATVEAALVAARRRRVDVAGVIVVHYGGLPCPDMDNVVRLCMREGLWIVEDAAHAHGAPGVGLRSHATAWSMCVGKIMSSGGEGGLVGCLDSGLAERMRAYRDHGRFQLAGRNSRDMSGAGVAGHAEFSYCVEDPGSNLRMTEMQSVLARSALARLPAEITRRRLIAEQYDQALVSVSREPMFATEQAAQHVRYLYHVAVDAAEKVPFMNRLNALGIPARFGGCDNIGKEPAFVKRGWSGVCPGADAAGATTFSLPVYPTMSDGVVARVCDALREVLG